MEVAAEASIFNGGTFIRATKHQYLSFGNRSLRFAVKLPLKNRILAYRSPIICCNKGCNDGNFPLLGFTSNKKQSFSGSFVIKSGFAGGNATAVVEEEVVELGFVGVLVRRGLVLMAMFCGVLIVGCRNSMAMEGVLNAGVLERTGLALRSSWPKVLQVLTVFKEQGLILAALLGLSAFFSMAETSITTLWPWKVPNYLSENAAPFFLPLSL